MKEPSHFHYSAVMEFFLRMITEKEPSPQQTYRKDPQ